LPTGAERFITGAKKGTFLYWKEFEHGGWAADLPDDQILQRLVALNVERAEEEKRGLIRWLRREFQNPAGAAETQATLALPTVEEPDVRSYRTTMATWPMKTCASCVNTLTWSSGQVSGQEVHKDSNRIPADASHEVHLFV
jgi:hypothetical protein